MIVQLLLAGSALFAAREPPAEFPDCRSAPGFVSELQLERAYGRRSVEIVEAALADDLDTLSATVAPGAQFRVMEADMGREVARPGPRGARDFFRTIAPESFHYVRQRVSVLMTQACGRHHVRLLLHAQEGRRAIAFSFRYEAGFLVEASGIESAVYEGRFGGAR